MTDERLGLASASKMDRIVHCPGSPAAEKEFSQDDSTEVTYEGDDVHEALETDDFEALSEDVLNIAERLKKMREDALEQWKEGKSGEEQIFTEKRFWIYGENKTKLASAQVDYAHIIGDHGFVLDYKTGYKPVTESHRNYQIRTQVVSFWKAFPHLKSIRGAVGAYRFQERFSYTDYSAIKLMQAERELKFVLWRASLPDAERVPGDWCDYCKAKANCPEARAKSLLPVTVIEHDSPKITDEDIAASVSRLDLEQLAYVHSKAGLANKVFDAIKRRLKAMPEAALNKVGLKFMERENYKPDDVSAIFKAFLSSGLLKKEECAGCCNIVIGRIAEIAIPRLMERGVATKKDASARIRQMLEPFMVKGPSTLMVTKMTKKELEDYDEKRKGIEGSDR